MDIPVCCHEWLLLAVGIIYRIADEAVSAVRNEVLKQLVVFPFILDKNCDVTQTGYCDGACHFNILFEVMFMVIGRVLAIILH